MNHLTSSSHIDKLDYTQNLLPQHQVAEVLFGDVRFRPTAQTMSALIGQGLTEADILAAGHSKGYQTPSMDETLRDLDAAIPYIQQLSDKIAEEHSNATLWLAARDFEAVADDLTVRYPHLEAHLLPASSNLLNHSSMENTDLANRFLGRYGLTATFVQNPSKNIAIFDSGFHGTIGQTLDRLIERLHGTSLQETGRLASKLVSVNTENCVGQQIMDFPGGASNFSDDKLPRASRCARSMHKEEHSDTQVLAVFLQTLPRFHDAYKELAVHNGKVVALPGVNEIEPGIFDNHIDNNVDSRYGVDYSPNASIVNPLAAAIVMHRIVKHALERRNKEMPRGSNSFALSTIDKTTASLGFLNTIEKTLT